MNQITITCLTGVDGAPPFLPKSIALNAGDDSDGAPFCPPLVSCDITIVKQNSNKQSS